MPDPTLLLIGKVRKAHGIRGEVSVDYYADSPNLLSGGVYLQIGATPPVFREVASVRAHHGAMLVKFVDFPDRSGAETLRGYDMLIPENRLPVPDDDSIYRYEILGLTVLAVNESGKETPLGTLRDVSEITGQELWTISRKGEEDILFPATPEFVIGFDLEAGIVRIAPPPGLVELYRP